MARNRRRGLRTPAVVLLCGLAALAGAAAAGATAPLLAPPEHPHPAEASRASTEAARSQLPSAVPSPSSPGPANVADLEAEIRSYYGDPDGRGAVAPASRYSSDTRAVAASAAEYLAGRSRRADDVVVFDVDDTLLTTWSYTVSVDWHFVPGGPAEDVRQQRFPAVPGMVELARAAAREGYVVVYLTGRPESQRSATLGNLTEDGVGVDAGYPKPTMLRDGTTSLVLRPARSAYPAYLAAACAADRDGVCTSAAYKTAVRSHLSALGYHVVADIGDQPSDVEGGWTGRVFRVPNPNYRVG